MSLLALITELCTIPKEPNTNGNNETTIIVDNGDGPIAGITSSVKVKRA